MAFESRDQIEDRYKWDLSSMYANDAAFEAALEADQELPAKLEAHRGKACTSAKNLLSYLRLHDDAKVEMERMANYADRRRDEDTRVARCQTYSARAMELYTRTQAATSWFATELMALPAEKLEQYMAEEPELNHYRRYFEQVLHLRPHTLSAPEEKLLASAQDMAAQPGQVYLLLNDADLTFPDAIDSRGEHHPVTHERYISLIENRDRALRKSAYDSLYGTYQKIRNTSAALLTSQEKQLKFFADARHYNSSLEMCLDENEVPTSVYGSLINAVHDSLPTFYRYASLRKKVLGVDELRFWDMYVPLVDSIEMDFTFDEATELIQKALAPLGKDYLDIVRTGLSQRWIDVYETPGKASGAYSAGSFGNHPVILLNYQGKLDDVFTLIHEMGHSVHTYLSCKTQGATYSDYSIFVAEVASTTNEALLTHYLLGHETDPARRAYILNHFAEQFRTTLYRQTMFAEFERDAAEMCAHNGGLTAEDLCERYGDLNKLYFGPEAVVDDKISLEWARIPHFYYDFYVYQYATSFAAAVALSERIINEGEPAVRDYLNFLSGGCSKTPIDLLRGAGVDMSTPKPVEDALAYFSTIVDQLEATL
ncbi:MAG: oligoendopeptidase F [Tractidigestivibacter sp.]|jgi:oligoendopeptidase F|uniref:oligoendopeptidase F n=1 Tax=Tractidigestivibacter sp. TaxID=2847320 RepID=UPI003D8CA2CB